MTEQRCFISVSDPEVFAVGCFISLLLFDDDDDDDELFVNLLLCEESVCNHLVEVGLCADLGSLFFLYLV